MNRLKSELRIQEDQPLRGQARIWIDVQLDELRPQSILVFSGDLYEGRRIMAGELVFTADSRMVESESNDTIPTSMHLSGPPFKNSSLGTAKDLEESSQKK